MNSYNSRKSSKNLSRASWIARRLNGTSFSINTLQAQKSTEHIILPSAFLWKLRLCKQLEQSTIAGLYNWAVNKTVKLVTKEKPTD